MQDRPSIDELLEAVAGFLHDDVMVNTTGRLSFHARVAGNVIQILRRELKHEEEQAADEWVGLNGLFGDSQELPCARSAALAALEERNRQLCARINAGGFDEGPPRAALLEHLRAVTRAKLVVSNPALVGAE